MDMYEYVGISISLYIHIYRSHSLSVYEKENFKHILSFRFTAKLRGRYKDSPYTPWHDTWVDSLNINLPDQSGTVVTINELTLTHQNNQVSLH